MLLLSYMVLSNNNENVILNFMNAVFVISAYFVFAFYVIKSCIYI